jgi:hypothetical protein
MEEKVRIEVGKLPKANVFVMDKGRAVNIHQSTSAIKLERTSQFGRTVTSFEVLDRTTLLVSAAEGLDLYFVVDQRAPSIQVMGGILVGPLRPAFYHVDRNLR